MPRTLELTLKRPDKSMKNTKTSAKHSNPKEKRPLFGQRRRAEELPGAQPCHQRGAHPPHSVSVHQRYDRMALPRGDPQKNGNTRIMHKSKLKARTFWQTAECTRFLFYPAFWPGNMLCGFANPLLPTAPFRAVFALSVTPAA